MGSANDQHTESADITLMQHNAPIQNARIAIVGTLAETTLGFRSELIRDFVSAGHEVFVFATDYQPETERAIRTMGATPVRYRMEQIKTNPFADLWAIWQLYRLFKRHHINVTYCYFSKPSIYGTLAAWLARVPKRIAKIEGLGRVFTDCPHSETVKKRALRHVMASLFRISLPKAHHVLVLNYGDKADLISFGVKRPEPIMIGGIGVCMNRYPFQLPVMDPVRFIFVGRLLPEKGVRYFVEAAQFLKQKYANVEFVLLGMPDNRPGAIDKYELKAFVKEGTVIWPGNVKDVTPWLAKSSVFVLPSYYREGVPRSTQEALAMGRPVITTDTPGCRQTVEHGINGFSIPIHDQQALEHAMERFITNPSLIRTMGLASYKMAQERFDVRQINRRVIEYIGLQAPEQELSVSTDQRELSNDGPLPVDDQKASGL